MSIQKFPNSTFFWFKNNQQQYWRSSFTELSKEKIFHTHQSSDSTSEKAYRAAHRVMLMPWKKTLQLAGYVLQPFPGENKKHFLIGLVKRINCFAGCLLLSPLSVFSLTCGLPLHIYGHCKRPFLSVIDQSQKISPLSENKNQLDVRSYNLGFTYETTSIIGDLRSPSERAREIAQHIAQEKECPDVICFQEAFHIDATQILCDSIKERYPYIIHNVAPHGLGLCSGLMIASRYPIEEVFFRRFNDLLGPERLSTRGLLGVRIKLGNDVYANVYNTHLQALHGKQRAEIRVNQLNKILQWMDEDNKRDAKDHRKKIGDFFMGDLNTSPLDLMGRQNLLEKRMQDLLNKHFINAFNVEHDELTGKRLRGKTTFLPPSLEEPSASSYNGPQANILAFKTKELFEKIVHHYQPGTSIKDPKPKFKWGTPQWTEGSREANIVRYDYQLLRKPTHPSLTISATAEIEHITTHAQSGPSDHLPIRAIYHWKYI